MGSIGLRERLLPPEVLLLLLLPALEDGIVLVLSFVGGREMDLEGGNVICLIALYTFVLRWKWSGGGLGSGEIGGWWMWRPLRNAEVPC